MMQVGEVLTEAGRDVTKTVFSDSSAARGMVRRTGTGKVRHVEAKYLWAQAKVRDKAIVVGTVDSDHNSSDMGTKFLTEKVLDGLLRLLPVVFGKRLEPGSVQRMVLMAATLPLVASMSEVGIACTLVQSGDAVDLNNLVLKKVKSPAKNRSLPTWALTPWTPWSW